MISFVAGGEDGGVAWVPWVASIFSHRFDVHHCGSAALEQVSPATFMGSCTPGTSPELLSQVDLEELHCGSRTVFWESLANGVRTALLAQVERFTARAELLPQLDNATGSPELLAQVDRVVGRSPTLLVHMLPLPSSCGFTTLPASHWLHFESCSST